MVCIRFWFLPWPLTTGTQCFFPSASLFPFFFFSMYSPPTLILTGRWTLCRDSQGSFLSRWKQGSFYVYIHYFYFLLLVINNVWWTKQIRRSGGLGGISIVLLFHKIIFKSQNGSSRSVAHRRPWLLCSLWSRLWKWYFLFSLITSYLLFFILFRTPNWNFRRLILPTYPNC